MAFILSACGGPSGGDGEVVDNAEPGVNIAMLDDSTGIVTNRIDENKLARVEIYLTDENNVALPDELVNVSATTGVLNQSVVLTDNDGRGSVLIYAPEFEGNTAPGTVTVSYQDTSAIKNYEFVASEAPVIATTGILVEMRVANSAGELTNEIPSDEYAYVTLTLLDDAGQPMKDKLINVSVTSGSIINNTNSVLTDENGQGTIQVSSPDITFGEYPGYLTASSESAVSDAFLAYQFYATNTNTVDNPIEVGSIIFQGPPSTTFMSLKGTGDLAYPTSSRVTFKVLTKDSQPLEGVQPEFSLSTEVGGLSLNNPPGNLTSATGEISVDVIAGNVATPVRVIASYADPVSGETVYTQSSELSITSGIPDQNSMSLSVSTYSPEAKEFDGITVDITARVADRYNNPVKDGTTINFIAESGKIGDGTVGSCLTTDSKCTVIWESQGERPVDNRNTILAYVIGHESFYDRNGNGLFDLGDNFEDLSEAFLDSDENGSFNPSSDKSNPAYTEIPLDYNENASFDGPDGLYNGFPCEDGGVNCPSNPGATLTNGSELLTHVRASNVLVSASSNPNVSVYRSNDGARCLDSDTGKIRANCDTLIDWGEASGNVIFPVNSNSITLSLIIEDEAALCFADSAGASRAFDGAGKLIIDPTDAGCVLAIRQSAPTGTSIGSEVDYTGTTVNGNTVDLDDLGITTFPKFSNISSDSTPSTRSALELLIIATPAINEVDYSGFYELSVKTPLGSERKYRINFIDQADF